MTASPDPVAAADALADGKAVGFWTSDDDPDGPPGFMMRAVGDAFQVRDGARAPVGTFADFGVAWDAGLAAAGRVAP